MFPIPFGVSMAATVRVGNLLGAGNGPQGKTVTKMTFALTFFSYVCFHATRKAKIRQTNVFL